MLTAKKYNHKIRSRDLLLSLMCYAFMCSCSENYNQNQKLKALVNEDTLLPMMFLGLRKLGNICCGHKTFLNKVRKIFPGHKICVRNKCCARGQKGQPFASATMCAWFARALSVKSVCIICRMDVIARVYRRSTILRLSSFFHADWLRWLYLKR